VKFKSLAGLHALAALALLLAASDVQAATNPGNAPAPAKRPAAARPAIVANVGDRTVDALDIQLAAASQADDPLRRKSQKAWRKSLLDLCVDRELLAMEAERRGIGDEPSVQAQWTDRQYTILYAAIYDKVLVPGITPSPQVMAEARASGLYRDVDLNYILIRDTPERINLAAAQRIIARLRAGASFDSLARIYSGHPPSAANGGHFGWLLARDLSPQSHDDIRTAKPGDILGVYSGYYGHEIYGIRAFRELSDDSLYHLLLFERGAGMYHDYDRQVLTKYHFTLDSTQVSAAIFATATESPDSILASLGPDGTRPRMGVRPALGILARCDGDSVTIADVIRSAPTASGPHGELDLRDAGDLAELCGRALLHRLIIRDAQARGIDKDPDVARELKMAREQILTQAMVAQARGASPDSAALRAFYEKHLDRYRRPAVTVAPTAVFSNRDTAAALAAWRAGPLTDEIFEAHGLVLQTGATATTLYPGHYATLRVPAGADDSLGAAIDGLSQGGRTGVVRSLQGYAVAQAASREPAGQRTFEEAAGEVARDQRADADNEWVTSQLTRLRASTKISVIPGRLDAVKLPASAPRKGTP
jgi:peptidyl-prolyl cis-trans isomerase C